MTVEERLAVLEQRLRRAEDELAIARLVASYGPLADAGDADAVAGLWAEDGEYDVDGWHMRSRADIAEMVRSPAHQGLISGGSAHFLGQVHIEVAGDNPEVAAFADAMNPMGRIGDPYLDIARLCCSWRARAAATSPATRCSSTAEATSTGWPGRPISTPRRDRRSDHAVARSWRAKRNVRVSRSGRVVSVTSTAPPGVTT
jgi:SnoaL-like domain